MKQLTRMREYIVNSKVCDEQNINPNTIFTIIDLNGIKAFSIHFAHCYEIQLSGVCVYIYIY